MSENIVKIAQVAGDDLFLFTCPNCKEEILALNPEVVSEEECAGAKKDA